MSCIVSKQPKDIHYNLKQRKNSISKRPEMAFSDIIALRNYLLIYKLMNRLSKYIFLMDFS